MKKFFKKLYNIDLLFIFILSLAPLLWFEKDVIMVGHDNVFPLNPGVFFNGRLFSWIDMGFGRSQALIMGTIPVHFIDTLPYLLGYSLQATQKLIYIFWFFMMGLSAYVLAGVLNKDRFFKLTAVVFYTYNFFILQGWWVGERTKFSAYIALPLVLAVFLKVYKNELNVIKGVILTSLILFIFNAGGLFGLSLYGGFFIAITVFIVFFSFLGIVQKEYATVKRILLLTFFSILSFFIFNAYYILPAFSQIVLKYDEGIQKSGGLSGFVNWASMISANASYINLMRLQGIAEWYDNPEHPYSKVFLTNPILILASFIWPVLIFLSLFLAKKKEKIRIVSYFMIVYLVGIFFTSGTHPPFGFLYTIFLKYIPGGVAFRSPYFKFAPSIFLASSFLIAFFICNFQGKTKKVVFFIMLAIILAYHFPYFTGNFFSWRKGFSARNKIPQYVYEFGKWAENDMKQNSRILLLPPANPNWQYDVYEWGYLSFQSLPSLTTNKGIVSNDDKVSNEEGQLLKNLYYAIDRADYDMTKKLSELMNIKYFLVRQDFESKLESMSVRKPDLYIEILEKKFNMRPVKNFDKWIVYKLDEKELSMFIMTNKLDNFFGSDKNIDKYFQFSEKNSNFVFSSNMKPYLQKDSSGYTIPECLNCRHEMPPPISFPKRLILPDSIFYPIIKYKEQDELRNLRPREATYANLGHSLKRIGEILEVLNQGRNINPKFLSNYLITLQRLERSFNSIVDYKDKFEAAEDIHYYLISQKNYLHRLLGANIYGKENLNMSDDVFEQIFKIENIIDPYLLKFDPSNNRFFLFDLQKPGFYEILLRKEEIFSLIKDKSRFTLLMDNKDKKDIDIDKENFQEKWLSFGKFKFSLGQHNILLFLPDLPDLFSGFKYRDNWLGSKLGDSCYGGNIKNYDDKKVYKLNFEIFNDFSDRIYVYEIRNRNGTEQIQNIIKLEKHFEKDTYQQLIYSLEDTENISFYICSSGIDQNVIQDKAKIEITEVIRPNLIIKPQAEPDYSKINLFYRRVNPTKYIVEINNTEPSFMIFNARYDDGWILSDFGNSHFKVNGYSNGWHIDKTGKYQLILEYQPQRYFYYGVIISLISVISGLIYLIRARDN